MANDGCDFLTEQLQPGYGVITSRLYKLPASICQPVQTTPDSLDASCPDFSTEASKLALHRNRDHVAAQTKHPAMDPFLDDEPVDDATRSGAVHVLPDLQSELQAVHFLLKPSNASMCFIQGRGLENLDQTNSQLTKFRDEEWPDNGYGPWKGKFDNAVAAYAWLKSPKKAPFYVDSDGTITDPSLPLVESNLSTWAQRIYDAMRNVNDIVEAQHSAVVKGLTNEVIFSQEHMEASAYEVVIEAIKLHKHGRCFPEKWDHSRVSKDMACNQKYNGRYDETFQLIDRLTAIEDQLRESKGAVRGVLEGGLPLQKLVNAPMASAKNRQNQRRSNINKAAYIRDGVSARQNRGYNFPRKSKFNDLRSNTTSTQISRSLAHDTTASANATLSEAPPVQTSPGNLKTKRAQRTTLKVAPW